MALLHKDVVEYDKQFPNPEGRQLICPRCKGGNGASEVAKKRKLKPILDTFCFTCWGYTRKEVKAIAAKVKSEQKTIQMAKNACHTSSVKATIARWKRKGRSATIRRTK